ncbi:MAG: hypothetical protein AAFR66_04300 [Bacteroidota bacterium]
MRAKDLDIPNINKKSIEELVANVTSRNHDGTLLVNLPVFSYTYSDTITPLRQQAESTIAALNEAAAYYMEISYGRFSFQFRLRSCALANTKAWRGNLEGITPTYDRITNLLTNRDQFPPVSDYTGYHPFKVFERDPNIHGTDPATNPVFRDYGGIFRQNLCEAIIEAAEDQGPRQWDFQGDLEDIGRWALKSGKEGLAFFSSSSVNRAVKRTLNSPISLGNGRSIRDFALDSELPRGGSWAVHAHELGHLFFGIYDYYNRVTNGRDLVRMSREGYLGSASLMALHFHGPHFDGFHKFNLGWLDPTIVTPSFSSKEFDLAPVYGSDKNVLLIRPEENNKPGEFFLLEVRTRNGRTADGHAIRYDQNLPNSLEGGVIVYHLNTTSPKGNKPNEPLSIAEPYIDIEGERFGSTALVSLKAGDGLSVSQTSFYGDTENGLEIKVLSIDTNGTCRIRITWNRRPRISAERTYPNGELHVLTRNESGDPLYKRFDGQKWFPSQEGWDSLGGKITGRPVCSKAGSALNVLVRGESGRPFHKKRLGDGSWVSSSWKTLGGGVIGPGSISKHGSYSEAVVKGSDSENVFVKWETSEGFNESRGSWENLGGPILGQPHSHGGFIQTSSGKQAALHIFARDLNGTPIHKYRANGKWFPGEEDWAELGGKIDTDPFGLTVGEDTYVFVRGTSGKVFVKYLNAEGWEPSKTGWVSLGGQILGPPCAAEVNGVIWVFATGISGGVFVNKGSKENWSGWKPLGGNVIDSPVATEGKGTIDVLVTGISGRVFHQRIDPNIWPPKENQWKSIGGKIV